jgi:hypothetical protein
MDFMAFLFVTLFFGYLGMVVWDQWEERRRNLFTDDGRFLRHQFLRALATAPTEPIALSPDAKFAVKQSSTAHRCEVCHQSDCFDVPTGLCQRCDHRTL